jgi:hypothetical protein
MVWSKWIWIVSPIVAVLGWAGTTIVRSWLEGTPLNGLRKLLGRSAAPTKKTALSIIVLTAPEPKWHIGANGKEPMLNLTIHANLAHNSDVPLKIVQAYLKGTKPYGVFFPFIVAGPYDEPSIIHFSVRPIIVKGVDKLTRRVVLVDQFGGQHVTAPVTFSTVPVEPWRRGMTDANPTIKCHICGQPISMMDLHESAAIPAHKQCVK